MSIAPTGKTTPISFEVAYTLKTESPAPRQRRPSLDELRKAMEDERVLVTDTAKRFEDKYSSPQITIAVADSKSFVAKSKNRGELESLPATFGLDRFVKGEIKTIGGNHDGSWRP